MKKIFGFLFLFLLFSSCGNFRLFPIKVKPSLEISEDNVPIIVKTAFVEKYPGITPEKWFMKRGERYVVRFHSNGVTTYAIYNKYGLFDEEEMDDPYYDELYDDSDDVYDWDWGDIYY